VPEQVRRGALARCQAKNGTGGTGHWNVPVPHPEKMQVAFEDAALALAVGQLSGIVETSSGIHLMLRLA